MEEETGFSRVYDVTVGFCWLRVLYRAEQAMPNTAHQQGVSQFPIQSSPSPFAFSCLFFKI